MAVPKRKTSKARRDKRKSANMKMTAPGLSICPQCHQPKLPHRVCPNCNYYDGKEIVYDLILLHIWSRWTTSGSIFLFFALASLRRLTYNVIYIERLSRR